MEEKNHLAKENITGINEYETSPYMTDFNDMEDILDSNDTNLIEDQDIIADISLPEEDPNIYDVCSDALADDEFEIDFESSCTDFERHVIPIKDILELETSVEEDYSE